MKAILLYSCDAWHSHDSKELIAVFTRKQFLVKYITAMIMAKKITEEDGEQLMEHCQTQGLDTNYMLEEENLNPKFKKLN